ncbi:ABC transporter permease [Oceanobacillus neutriphilus]|uniref:Oligopeptide transport system permease protein OppB n=1 Tax=Oceanobacillus neutriphilus TaxID=531815 RepID=A0ABQ2NR79_9BACI|nr:ABC transporter permease [Oceanobacillus neutriphilus]GGP07809.1 oligopeptide transport system permease protein OppB [Oceanobacillus neutriphilus]
MLKYFFQRFLIACVTILILITVTFFLIQLLPGDPFLDPKLPVEVKENMMEYYGLNDPLYMQYFNYLGNLFQGDLGYSLKYKNLTVNEVIMDAFPKSVELGLYALLISILFGLTLGIIAALEHNKKLDFLSMFIALIGISVPAFIIGGLFQYFFAVKLHLFPVAQWQGFSYTVLPSFALALGSVALIARLMRASMLEIVSTDYVKTADAKGLSRGQIILRHQIRNAVLPVLTILGPLLANLVTGTFVIEKIFAVPGLGKYYVESMQTLDYTMILGLTIFFGSFLVVVNLLIDFCYGIIDPRIRTKKAGG